VLCAHIMFQAAVASRVAARDVHKRRLMKCLGDDVLEMTVSIGDEVHDLYAQG
ncbi:hypothetical protein ACJX0J_007738, partial [Zea mays]